MNKKFLVFSILAAIVLIGLNAKIWAQEPVYDHQLKLILKILSYDKNFERYGSPVKIGVSSDEAMKAFTAKKGNIQIGGKTFEIEKMASSKDISKFKVIYVDKNWRNAYKEAAEKAFASKSLMFCREEEGVINCGGAISFKYETDRTKVVINLNAAQNMGANFTLDQFINIDIPVVVEIGGKKVNH